MFAGIFDVGVVTDVKAGKEAVLVDGPRPETAIGIASVSRSAEPAIIVPLPLSGEGRVSRTF
jgi:hypothetical protein